MAVWNITAKDLSLLMRDRRTIAVLLLLPLVFILIIGMTTGKFLGWRSSNQMLKIAVLDRIDYDAIGSAEFVAAAKNEDETDADAPATQPLSARERDSQRNIARHVVVDILNGIQTTPGLQVRSIEDWQRELDLPPDEDPEEAVRYMLADGKINAALIFEPDFYQTVYHLRPEAAIKKGDEGSPVERFRALGIEFITESPNSSTASAVAAIAGGNVRDVIGPILLCRSFDWSVAQRASPRYRNLCGPVNAMGNAPPAQLLPPQTGNNAAISASIYEEIVPGYTVMFVFFLVNIMGHSFLHERQIGTMRRLRMAPISGWSILVGKTIPFLIVSLLQTAVLFLAGRFLFGMSWGDHPWMLVPVIVATSCAATGLGLLIATLVGSDAQVSAYSTTTVIVLAGISGCFMPRQFLPDLMLQLSLATPHAWALIAYDQLLSSGRPNLNTVWQCVGMLFGFAAIFFTIGGLRFSTQD